METKLVKIEDLKNQGQDMDEAADLIKAGEVVAFPTETVYGLGADGLNKYAVQKIFQAKGRPQDNPLILHVDSIQMLKRLVKDIPQEALLCIEKFWPGPLTILFRKADVVPDIITAGLDTVAIRMPRHPVALELIKKSGTPIAAPSANTSGRPSPTRADHVVEDMEGKIAMILDGGETGVGLESTVLDLTEEVPMILRPGGITVEDIEELLPKVSIDPGLLEETGKNIIPKSPGQKYRHYAPKACMVLFSGESEKVVREIIKRGKEEEAKGRKIGLLVTEENRREYPFQNVVVMGSSKDNKTIAHGLFHAIRRLDELDVDIILCESVREDNIGMAIMNRLLKAAGGNRINL
ncbi:MAG: L-threonylcarbamoyladenylate synthase [Bacillota bacterium]